MTAIDVRDGRSARSVRTRRAVVEALLDLIEQGDLRPTARLIAERAGVSQRSVYVHFDDLEDLFAEASKLHLERVVANLEMVDSGLPLETRIAKLAEQAARTLEATLAVRRAASIQEPFSPTLAKTLDRTRRAARTSIERIFATELAVLDPPTRRRRTAALVVATASYTWETLRLHQQLDVDAAQSVVADLLTAMIDLEQ